MPKQTLENVLIEYRGLFSQLYFAIAQNDYNMIYDVMAVPGMDVNHSGPWPNGITPLYIAYHLKNLIVFEIFLKMGANPNTIVDALLTDSDSIFGYIEQSLLRHIITEKVPCCDKYAFITLLLEYGARETVLRDDLCDTTYLFGTCLHVAARAGDMEIIKLLLNYGFDPFDDCCDNSTDNGTPIMIAKKYKHDDCATFMEENFEPHVAYRKLRQGGQIKDAAYDHVFYAMRKKFGLKRDSIYRIRFFAFKTPGKMTSTQSGKFGTSTSGEIFTAAENNDLQALERAIIWGAVYNDNNSCKWEFNSPLLVAVKNGNLDMVKKFIGLKADLVGRGQSARPYDLAIKKKFDEIAGELLKAKKNQLIRLKSDLNLQDKNPDEASLVMPTSPDEDPNNSNNTKSFKLK